MPGKQTRLGFWSVDLKTGLVSCCPVTAAILHVPEHSAEIGAVLACVDRAARPRLLRVALRSLQNAVTFDTIVRTSTRTGTGTKKLRLIGGRGYQSDQRRPELHGIIDEILF